MPSTSSLSRIYEWATTQRNLTIFVSILVAVPTAYAFQSMVTEGDWPGTFSC